MKKKIIVCFFGVISRSIRYTHKSIERNLIDVLKKNNYDVDIYVFNNNVGNCKVDGCKSNNMDYKLLKPTYFEEKSQKDIDSIINTTIKTKNIDCDFKYYGNKSGKPREVTINNCVRQMYSEEQVGNFLEKNKDKYDAAVVCGPDYYLLKPLDLNDINKSISCDNIIYTTDINDGQGYTNGFYLGSLEPMIKILKRFSIMDILLPTEHDYEYLLKKTFELNKIERNITSMQFVKIRNNKKIQPQGKMRQHCNPRITKIIKKISKCI